MEISKTSINTSKRRADVLHYSIVLVFMRAWEHLLGKISYNRPDKGTSILFQSLLLSFSYLNPTPPFWLQLTSIFAINLGRKINIPGFLEEKISIPSVRFI